MSSKERREDIKAIFLESKLPIKGQELATKFNVTRQVIVKDIAILRAEGNNIIATPEGYLITRYENTRIRRVIAVNHDREDVYKELKTVVKYGGIVEDVIVEHPLYGEIKAILMIKNLNDVEKFNDKFDKSEVEPLFKLTNGIHIHTITVDSIEDMENILKELKNENILIDN